MTSLRLFKNHEMMHEASEIMRSDYAAFEMEGGQYDSEALKLMARHVLLSVMPHVCNYLQGRIEVEADKAHLMDGDEITPVEGLHVQGRFKHIEFQPAVLEEIRGEHLGLLLFEEYDLFAVVRPQFVDPEPGHIVLSDEVMVPFSEITKFEPVESRAA